MLVEAEYELSHEIQNKTKPMVSRSRQSGKTNTYGLKVGAGEQKGPCLYRLKSEKILERTLTKFDLEETNSKKKR